MTTAKISEQSANILARLQKRYHKPKTVLIDQALKQFEAQSMLNEINNGYAKLKSDKKNWKEELKERAQLQGTLCKKRNT